MGEIISTARYDVGMWLDVAAIAVFLLVGNVVFRHFEPMASTTRRVLKVVVTLAITAAVSYYFGRKGVVLAFTAVLMPVIYIHAIWLPSKGVNGWTGEPKAKYYALRGWPPPKE
jgi:hypothetical protein